MSAIHGSQPFLVPAVLIAVAHTKETETSAPEPVLPPKPEEPVPGECCGRGCVNCVWVYYERALERWKQRCEEIRAGIEGENAQPPDSPHPGVSPS
jgi:hypothetical protein